MSATDSQLERERDGFLEILRDPKAVWCRYAEADLRELWKRGQS